MLWTTQVAAAAAWSLQTYWQHYKAVHTNARALLCGRVSVRYHTYLNYEEINCEGNNVCEREQALSSMQVQVNASTHISSTSLSSTLSCILHLHVSHTSLPVFKLPSKPTLIWSVRLPDTFESVCTHEHEHESVCFRHLLREPTRVFGVCSAFLSTLSLSLPLSLHLLMI